ELTPHRTTPPRNDGHRQVLPRRARAQERPAHAAPGRGAGADGGERGGQEHADQGARRGARAGRGHDPHRRQGVRLRHAAGRQAGGRGGHLPGVQPRPGHERPREH
ncbi:MAG: Ribose ABC transport system, ATP-binding protein RbsA, partial [uncultured Thermomicrobiales bacterium]